MRAKISNEILHSHVSSVEVASAKSLKVPFNELFLFPQISSHIPFHILVAGFLNLEKRLIQQNWTISVKVSLYFLDKYLEAHNYAQAP